MTRGTTAWPSVEVLRFDLFDGISHGISTRHGGVSPDPYATLNVGLSTGDSEENVLENRRRFVQALGVALQDVAVGRLSHGSEITVVRGDSDRRVRPVRTQVTSGQRVFHSDAAISDRPGEHVFLTFADCVPIVFADLRRGVVGAAHAGWRGTALGIAPAVVRSMQVEFGSHPRDIVVGIGPSIGPCCYEVGTEVLTVFRGNGSFPVSRVAGGRIWLDLWATNERQLREVGIAPTSIENPRICTSCHVSRFFSHRAEGGKTGRFALCIGRA